MLSKQTMSSLRPLFIGIRGHCKPRHWKVASFMSFSDFRVQLSMTKPCLDGTVNEPPSNCFRIIFTWHMVSIHFLLFQVKFLLSHSAPKSSVSPWAKCSEQMLYCFSSVTRSCSNALTDLSSKLDLGLLSQMEATWNEWLGNSQSNNKELTMPLEILQCNKGASQLSHLGSSW